MIKVNWDDHIYSPWSVGFQANQLAVLGEHADIAVEGKKCEARGSWKETIKGRACLTRLTHRALLLSLTTMVLPNMANYLVLLRRLGAVGIICGPLRGYRRYQRLWLLAGSIAEDSDDSPPSTIAPDHARASASARPHP